MEIEIVPTAADLKAIKNELKRRGVKENELEAALAEEVKAVSVFVETFNHEACYKVINERDLPTLFHAQMLASAQDSNFAKVAKSYRCGARYAIETRLSDLFIKARRAAYNASASKGDGLK